MPNYGDPRYWEERYKTQKSITFDWLEDYSTLKLLIEEFGVGKESSVLVLGCGNAEFSEHMYKDGYLNIYNIDIARNVIATMKERNKAMLHMKYEVMDVRDLKYDNGTFDLAIDKSTIDALLCGEKSFSNTARMLNEVQRVLKQGGVYMIISYGSPENRLFHLEREFLSFDISVYTIKKEYIDTESENMEKTHYVYVCRKRHDADKIYKKYYESSIKELERQDKLEEDLFYNENN
jgi:ubiquinone/menaquinone biosynthesis C-methylase UbiE